MRATRRPGSVLLGYISHCHRHLNPESPRAEADAVIRHPRRSYLSHERSPWPWSVGSHCISSPSRFSVNRLSWGACLQLSSSFIPPHLNWRRARSLSPHLASRATFLTKTLSSSPSRCDFSYLRAQKLRYFSLRLGRYQTLSKIKLTFTGKRRRKIIHYIIKRERSLLTRICSLDQ